MSFSIQNQNINQTQNFSTSSSSSTSQASGSLMGQQVKMHNNPMSLLAACAEELTFAVDTTDEFEMQERKEKEVVDIQNSEVYELYRKVMEQQGDNNDKSNLKNDIAQMKGAKNADTLKQLAKDLAGGDAAKAFMSLQEVYEELKKDGAEPALLNELNSAIKSMEANEKTAIVASMQAEITGADPSFTGLDNKNQFYAQTVDEFLSARDVYKHINEKYAGKSDLAMDFLYKTLANDLNASMSSMEKSQLTNISTNLGELRSFQSAHALCDRFVTRLQEVHQLENFKYTGFEVMGKVLDFKDQNYLGSNNIEDFMKEAKAQNPEQEVFFLQELLSATKQFSTTLFDSTNDRMKIIDAVQEAVDTAVAREDEWLENLQ